MASDDGSYDSLHWHGQELFRTSPFHVNQDDVAALQSCEAFQAIQSSLVKQRNIG
jgi:hypothetical protein